MDESSTNGDYPQALEEAVVVTATLAPSEIIRSSAHNPQEALSRSTEEPKESADNQNTKGVSCLRSFVKNWGYVVLAFVVVVGAAIGVALVLTRDGDNKDNKIANGGNQSDPPMTENDTETEEDLSLSAGLTPNEEIEVRSRCPGIQFWGATEPLLTQCPIDANNCDTSQGGCAELNFEESVIFNGNQNSIIYQQSANRFRCPGLQWWSASPLADDACPIDQNGCDTSGPCDAIAIEDRVINY